MCESSIAREVVTRPALSLARDEHVAWAAAVAGDRDAFAIVTARYRRERPVHCYRMLGSLDDAEDLVQATLLRAWRRRESFRGRSTLRAWLYGIATNACLDALDRRGRRLLPPAVTSAADPLAPPPPASEVGWLEPYPDQLLDELVDEQAGPDETLVARDTIERAFMVAIHASPDWRSIGTCASVASHSSGVSRGPNTGSFSKSSTTAGSEKSEGKPHPAREVRTSSTVIGRRPARRRRSDSEASARPAATPARAATARSGRRATQALRPPGS